MWRAQITVVSHIQRLSLLDHCFSNVLRYSIHSIMWAKFFRVQFDEGDVSIWSVSSDQYRKHHQSPEAGLVSLPSQYPTEANTILTCLNHRFILLALQFYKKDLSMHLLCSILCLWDSSILLCVSEAHFKKFISCWIVVHCMNIP